MVDQYILVKKTLQSKNSQFKNNNVNHYGAGICTEDNLFVQNCTFIKNEAIAAGGAIYSKKRVTVNSSTFEDNVF